MAVSKTRSAAEIRSAIEAGVDLFGESRVQEAAEKWPDIRRNSRVRLELVGHLQRNKADAAARLFDCVASIDAIRTVDALERRLRDASSVEQAETSEEPSMDVLVEVNTSEEPQKYGVVGASALWELLDAIAERPCFRLRGLMTIAPLVEDEGSIRHAFRSLRRLYEQAHDRGFTGFDTLSMGMSDDYHLAIQEGSTVVRIGTAIFARRAY